MFVLSATLVAPTAGVVENTVGRVLSTPEPVVKVHTLLKAKALPARSVTPVVIVAVYWVLAVRAVPGAKIAAAPVHFTVPEIRFGPWLKVNVPGVQLAGATVSLKYAAIFWLVATPVAALIGFVSVTVGLVVSAGGPPPPPLSSLAHPAINTSSSDAINHIE